MPTILLAPRSHSERAQRHIARWISAPSLAMTMARPSLGGWWFWAASALATAVALVLVALLVYETGGTQYAYPYLILLPVIFAGSIFKVPGGILAAVAAALLLGPYMPLSVEEGIMQTTQNWLIRLGMYVLIGAFAGALASGLDWWHQRIAAEARIDSTSGLLARAAAEKIVSNAADAPVSGFSPTHAVAVGFDGYYNVVLALGIDVGNAAIRRLGQAITEFADDHTLVTRIHGATFCALVSDGVPDVTRFLERCSKEVPRAFRLDGIPMTLLPRFGIAALSAGDLGSGLPFRKALVALRTAQDDGRQFARFDESQDEYARDNLHLLSEFRADLEQGLCEVHFQPKLSLSSRRVFGVEALIRWNSPKRGPVSPGRFVPLIENTMLIDSLTRFVIDRSARTLADWRRNGLEIDIAINLSTRNLEDADLVAFLLSVPDEYGVPAAAIELEVTETALMRGIETVRDALQQLRTAGYTIAIDDFGTGYSSFGYLKELPVDWVKLDQSFVRDLPENTQSREISAATVAICKRLGYKVIAEGVETLEALQFLIEHGYDAVQGYHLARPMPANAVSSWVAKMHATG